MGGITLAWSLVATAAPPDIPEFALENPAPGVYVHYGQQAEMSRANCLAVEGGIPWDVAVYCGGASEDGGQPLGIRDASFNCVR